MKPAHFLLFVLAVSSSTVICAQVNSAGSQSSQRAGNILRVETYGLDSLQCGALEAPCRSISQAVRNAVRGDTIRVGPGHYGDLDEDGVAGEDGEERAEAGAVCNCMLSINKKLTIISTNGALETIIETSEAY